MGLKKEGFYYNGNDRTDMNEQGVSSDELKDYYRSLKSYLNYWLCITVYVFSVLV